MRARCRDTPETTQGMATPLDLASEAALHSGPIRGSSVSSFCAFLRLFPLPFVLRFVSIRGPFCGYSGFIRTGT
jgi:hypothetical protein